MGQEADTPDIKRLLWRGPEIQTDAGRTIFGVVGRTHNGMLRPGYGDVYREHGPTNRLSFESVEYEWSRETHKEVGHAIFAARNIVKREVDFARGPDRHQPEEKAASPAGAEKIAPKKDSPQGRFDALLSKLRRSGPKKDTPVKRGRSIDR